MNPSAPLHPTLSRPAKVGFWDQTLGYPHAFITVVMALTLGLAFHQWVGYDWIHVWPPVVLATLFLAPLVLIAVLARVRPGQRVIKWLTGIPFAMLSTGAVGLLALLGGVFPQRVWQERLGLDSIWSSWPFLMVTFLMMLNLVGSSGRRAWPLTYTNVVYLTSHLGLAIAILGGGLSALTLERHTMVLFKGMPTTEMMDRHEHTAAAPFKVELREFRMETFAPTLTLATLDAKSPDGLKQKSTENLVKPGLTERVQSHVLKVEKFFKHAAFDGLHWREVPWKTAAPAAFVRVTLPDGKSKSGWVSSGSPETMPAYLQLSKDTAVLMNPPRPKKFESDLLIDGEKMTVGVNQPALVKGYDLYQFSYDEKRGAASAYSVIEVVRDRGLPVVYFGIFTMLFGAMLHLWNGIGGKK